MYEQSKYGVPSCFELSAMLPCRSFARHILPAKNTADEPRKISDRYCGAHKMVFFPKSTRYLSSVSILYVDPALKHLCHSNSTHPSLTSLISKERFFSGVVMMLSVLSGAISLACGLLVLGRPLTTRQLLGDSPPDSLGTPDLQGKSFKTNLGPFWTDPLPGSSTGFVNSVPSPELATPVELAFSNLGSDSAVQIAKTPQPIDLSDPVELGTSPSNTVGLPSRFPPAIADASPGGNPGLTPGNTYNPDASPGGNPVLTPGNTYNPLERPSQTKKVDPSSIDFGSTLEELHDKYVYCFYKLDSRTGIGPANCGSETPNQSAKSLWNQFTSAFDQHDFVGFALYRLEDDTVLSIEMVQRKCRTKAKLGVHDSHTLVDCGEQVRTLNKLEYDWIEMIKIEFPNVAARDPQSTLEQIGQDYIPELVPEPQVPELM